MSSHLDASGKAVMVDITAKTPGPRTAGAAGTLIASPAVLDAIRANSLQKGDALAVARVAGIMAVKNTPSVIPLCHTIPITACGIDFVLGEDRVRVTCTVACHAKTGAEMEALNGVTAALLTLYDMAKSIDKTMTITDIELLTKTGGKSGDFTRS